MAKRFLAASAAFVLLLLLGGAPKTSFADESAGSEKPKAGSIMDPSVGRHLKAAVAALQAQQYPQAETELGELNLDHLSPYERSRAEQLYAVAEQMQDHYDGARAHLKAAIDSGGLNDQDRNRPRLRKIDERPLSTVARVMRSGEAR